MTRDLMANMMYWRERVVKDIVWIEKSTKLLSEPSKNPEYDPQFSFDLTRDILRLMFRQYSRGDSISEVQSSFPKLLDMWELSNQLSDRVSAEYNLKTCRDWLFDLSDLNHYIYCFWLVGLALALHVPDHQWSRLLVLIGEEGRDVLLDRVIASRQHSRVVGSVLLHNKPYARLLKAIDAPKEQQSILLREFVSHWYMELNRSGKQQPWWYHYGDPDKYPLEQGSYFGRWCVEAAGAVQAFGLDDSQCLGLPHYPGDLLRPNGPTTHAVPLEQKAKRRFKFFRF